MGDTTISKNRTSGKDGKYSYKYTDIAQIHEYLESKGITYYQFIDNLNGVDYVMTVPVIEGKELAPRRGCRVVDATLVGINNPAQQQGSAITYARRYSLLMAFGLATEDDDAQALSVPKTVQNAKQNPGSKVTMEQVIDLKNECQLRGVPETEILKRYGKEKLEDLQFCQYEKAISILKGM